MVALHNRRLTPKDIWPDGIWTFDDEMRVSRQMDAQVIDEGLSGSEALFRHARLMEEYRRRTLPRLAVRQAVMKQIYKPRPKPPAAPRLEFTPEEIDYLIERLHGVNDPVGASACEKLRALRAAQTMDTTFQTETESHEPG